MWFWTRKLKLKSVGAVTTSNNKYSHTIREWQTNELVTIIKIIEEYGRMKFILCKTCPRTGSAPTQQNTVQYQQSTEIVDSKTHVNCCLMTLPHCLYPLVWKSLSFSLPLPACVHSFILSSVLDLAEHLSKSKNIQTFTLCRVDPCFDQFSTLFGSFSKLMSMITDRWQNTLPRVGKHSGRTAIVRHYCTDGCAIARWVTTQKVTILNT